MLPVVEMIGLSGAGKSTLASRLLPLLAGPEGDFVLLSRPRVRGTAALLRTVMLVAATLRHSPGIGLALLSRSDGRRLALKLGHRVAGLETRDGSRPALIVESGLLQPLVFFGAQRSEPIVARSTLEVILAVLPLPDVVVRVNAPPAVAFSRYKTREELAGRRVQGSVDSFERAAMTVDSICVHMRREGKEVMTFDSAVPLDPAAIAELAERLRSRCRAAGDSL